MEMRRHKCRGHRTHVCLLNTCRRVGNKGYSFDFSVSLKCLLNIRELFTTGFGLGLCALAGNLTVNSVSGRCKRRLKRLYYVYITFL